MGDRMSSSLIGRTRKTSFVYKAKEVFFLHLSRYAWRAETRPSGKTLLLQACFHAA